MAVLAVAVGLAGGFGAVGFRYLINFFQTLAYGSSDELLHVVLALPWYLKVWVPAPAVWWSARWCIFLQRRPRVTACPK